MLTLVFSCLLIYKLSFVNVDVTLLFLYFFLFDPVWMFILPLLEHIVKTFFFFNCVEVNPTSGIPAFSWRGFS